MFKFGIELSFNYGFKLIKDGKYLRFGGYEINLNKFRMIIKKLNEIVIVINI